MIEFGKLLHGAAVMLAPELVGMGCLGQQRHHRAVLFNQSTVDSLDDVAFCRQNRQDLAAPFGQHRIDKRLKDHAFIGEVGVERRLGDAGGARNRFHAGAAQPVPQDQRTGGSENGVASVGGWRHRLPLNEVNA